TNTATRGANANNSGYGAGLAVTSIGASPQVTLNLTNCSFWSNVAKAGSGTGVGLGGGWWASLVNVVSTGGIVAHNVAAQLGASQAQGGGIYADRCSLTIDRQVIRKNVALNTSIGSIAKGGGVAMNIDTGTTTVLVNNVIVDNQASLGLTGSQGAAIAVDDTGPTVSAPIINFCTMANAAPNVYSGVYCE